MTWSNLWGDFWSKIFVPRAVSLATCSTIEMNKLMKSVSCALTRSWDILILRIHPGFTSNVRISVPKISELVIDLISSRRTQKSYFITKKKIKFGGGNGGCSNFRKYRLFSANLFKYYSNRYCKTRKKKENWGGG